MEKLSREHKQMVTDAVISWIDPNNQERSGNKLAELSKVNQAYISRIKDGNYTFEGGGERISQIGDQAFHRLADYLDIKFEGGLHWPTIRNYSRIMAICRKAQKKAIRYTIDGPTGQSKTFTLEKYAKKNEYVIYVKCTMNMSAKNLVDAILSRLNVHVRARGVHEKLEMIRRIVTGKKGMLIIVDEAEVVKPGIYAVIKDISDFIHNKSGMIICGFGLINKLDRLAGRQKPGYPQLRRRFFGNVETLGKVSDGEIVEICTSEGITNKGAQNVIVNQCEDLDKLAQWIADVKEWQQRESKKITGEEVCKLFGVVGLNLKAA